MKNSNTSRNGLARRISLSLQMAALFVHAAYAIDPNRAMSQYIRESWENGQDFPPGPVYAITQTADGYLWIGAEAGLIRFDGSNFRLTTTPLPSALGLEPAGADSLWVRMEGPTLMRYREGIFDPVERLGVNGFGATSMYRAPNGELIVSALGRGSLALRGGKFVVLCAAAALPRSPIISTAETGDGVIWMGTRDAGLYRLENGRTIPVGGLPDAKVNCLLPDGEHNLWVGTDNGIALWNGSKITTEGLPISLRGHQVLAMAKDRDANVWVGTDAADSGGLLRFNSYGVSSLAEEGKGAVTALFEDREGGLWVGRAGGLERLRDSAFVTYSGPQGLPSPRNGPVFPDPQGRVWFAPMEGGLYWLGGERHGHVAAAGLDSDVVYSLSGGADELWIGRRRGGLTQLGLRGAGVVEKTYRQAEGLAQDSVYSVYRARSGAVWAGTLSAGVSRLKDGGFTAFTVADGLASNTVASILETADKNMWFATPNGLSSFSEGRWRTYTDRDGLPSPNVNCLFEDSAGVLWIGTTSGIAARSAGRFQVPRDLPATLREPVLGIAEDNRGSLWLSTIKHVLRVDRAKLLSGDLADGDLRQFGVADGLHGAEGVKRSRSVLSGPDGRIWFSLNQGLSVVDPARLMRASAPAIVHIQTASADGAPVGLRGPIRIPSNRHRISLGYAGLSLSNPGGVRFRYRLDPFDRAWSDPVAAREAVYTNLSPGPYRFRVIASTPDGLWNGAESTMDFEIDPAIWQSWWFRLTALLALGLVIYAAYFFRLHQMTGQLSMRFEERLAERARIAQDLHDTLLQGFLSASMQLHVAADRVPETSPAKPQLTRVIELMGEVIEEGRKALRGLRSSPGDSFLLEQAFARVPEELTVGSDVVFRIVVSGRPRKLHPLMRDEVYRIGREALVNAFRHSQSKAIELELEYAARHLRLLVRDDGCGIDPDVVRSGREGHWGLPGMRERADRIGARFHVWSDHGNGTEVELSVPSHIAFQPDQHRNPFRWFFRRRKNNERSDTNS